MESSTMMAGKVKSKIRELELQISVTNDWESKLKLELILSNYYIALSNFCS